MSLLRGFYLAAVSAFLIAALGAPESELGRLLVSPAAAQNAKGPAVKGPMTRPSPSRPRPSIGMTRPSFNKGPSVRPKPVRPRPGIGMTRPSFNNGQGIRPIQVRPLPVRPRPGIGMTRPNYNNGQGVKPIQVRPRPQNPYPQYPDFVDTPESVNDLRPVRPPIHQPPHYRPPHGIWGDWYWYANIGWYHRYRIGGTTIVIVDGLPAGCRKRVRRAGKIYYKCNGVYYKAQIVRGERVYQVLSLGGSNVAASTGALRLTKPFMRGPRVLELQKQLKRRGYNVGTPDGVFGRGTERALKRFQSDVGLTPDGVAGRDTLRRLRK